jgi:hypothetical protein
LAAVIFALKSFSAFTLATKFAFIIAILATRLVSPVDVAR